MTRTIRRTVHLAASPERVWEHVQTPHLMQHVGSPMIRFVPVGGGSFPEQWSVGEHKAWLYLFGFLPLGWQVIGIELPAPEPGRYRLRDNGYSPMIRRWDHRIMVESDGEGTRYTDEIEVDAGLLTPVVAWGANLFFAHRQRRLLALDKRDFRYD